MSDIIRKRIDKYVKVNDDWYPCFDGNTIQVSLFLYYIPNYPDSFVRIMAWGKDDFGLEMDYECENYDTLVSKFDEWKTYIYDKAVDGINKEWFYNYGLYDA